MPPLETHGPDRCRTSLNCINYHDPTVSRTGQLMHYCCCNTCIAIRPGGELIREVQYEHCCRCIPRMILLRFSPLGTDSCCAARSVPMVFSDTDGDYISTYTGTLYGITVTAKIGERDIGTGTVVGTGTGDECAWHITAVRNDPAVDIELIYLADDIVASCLDVSGIEIGNVAGPNDCEGVLTLDNMEAERLPFLRREDLTGTGTSDDRLIELDPACGDCTQVCRTLCIDGAKTVDGARERVEFSWFDNGIDDRGWKYVAPNSDEYIIYLLESESGTGTKAGTGTDSACILSFSWVGGEDIPNRIIDLENGCSCGILESIVVDIATGFIIRCGFCTYWDFFCGQRRCVPPTLCAQIYVDNVFYPNFLLEWDEDTRCWVDDDVKLGTGTGTGTGTSTQNVSVCLSKNLAENCIITATIDNVQISDPVTLESSDEHTTNEFDPTSDFISESFEEYTEDTLTWMSISSQTDDCVVGICTSATPCVDECGSHPAVVTLTLIGTNEEPGGGPGCSIEMDLHFTQGFNWGIGLETYCEYVGFAFLGYCPQVSGPDLPRWVKAVLGDGKLSLFFYEGANNGYPCTDMSEIPIEETCDPYYGDSGVVATGLSDCCLNCDEAITQFQAIIVEGS